MKKIISLLLLTTSILFAFSSCLISNLFSEKKEDLSTDIIRVGVLNGPTGMGMAKMMQEQKEDAKLPYQFQMYSSPDVALTDFLAGNLDIVSLPTNTASLVFNKHHQGIQVLAVNCLSSLFVVSKTESHIKSLSDLNGKAVAMSVPSSTTQPIIEYLTSQADIHIQIEMYGTHDALIAEMMKANSDIEIAVIPEPKVTALLFQNDDYEISLSVGDIWYQTTGFDLPMGCIIAKSSFVSANSSFVLDFLNRYSSSVNFIADAENLNEAADMIVNAGILPKVPQAKQALTHLDGAIVFHQGEQMKTELLTFYTLLLASKPDSIGNALPKEDFYYDY